MPRSSKVSCCIFGCSNTYTNTENGVSFYSFPTRPWDKERRRKWVVAVNRKAPDGSLWEPTAFSKVCSSHFIGGKKSNHPHNPAYVPSIFPSKLRNKPGNDGGLKRFQRRLNRKNIEQMDIKVENGSEAASVDSLVVTDNFSPVIKQSKDRCTEVNNAFAENQFCFSTEFYGLDVGTQANIPSRPCEKETKDAFTFVHVPNMVQFLECTCHGEEWIRFFTDAGLPEDVSTGYALIFYENRIQKNMLMDLNKEYLRDMGIKVMGDVIAILRFAKLCHEKIERKRILGAERENPQSSVEFIGMSPSPQSVKSSTKIIVLGTASKEQENTLVLKSDLATRKKRIESPDVVKKELQTLEVPVPKVRRVDPEHEGGYKIKMPSGNTERSKQLLEKAKQKNKTVFDRLGESSVTSTTPDVMVKTHVADDSNSKKTMASVFARLGGKSMKVTSSTSNTEDEVSEYGGVLKKSKTLIQPQFRAAIKSSEKATTSTPPVKKLKAVSTEVQGVSISIMDLKKDLIKQRENLRITRDLDYGDDVTSGSKLSSRFEDSNLGGNKKFDNFVIKTGVDGSAKKLMVPVKRCLEEHGTDEEDAAAPSKKVRFGGASHRLIPPSEPKNNVKNMCFPKLTMKINNKSTGKAQARSKTALLTSSRVQKAPGLLSSDKQNKVSLGARLGAKGKPDGVTSRLGGVKKVGGLVGRLGVAKKPNGIHARLG